MLGETTSEGTPGISIPNPISINYKDDDYVKEVAKTLFANANLTEMDNNGNLVDLGDAKVQAIANKCVKYAKMLLKALKS